jgi:hypothetical protein
MQQPAPFVVRDSGQYRSPSPKNTLHRNGSPVAISAGPGGRPQCPFRPVCSRVVDCQWAAVLTRDDVREDIGNRLVSGQPVFIYFDKKTSGELSIPPTPRSPEFSFDVTIVELSSKDGVPHIGRFGILEIQTMDFYGSYRDAVRNLGDALRMHKASFAETIQNNQPWLAQGVEGPNIANVFKRTFYQMMFKFQLGHHERCAGCVRVIDEGFAWEGKTYDSLSSVAFAITGTKWSGPRFFGLRGKQPDQAAIGGKS